jgi:threonine/homoserine/homoserine lactone efflux protein
MTPGLLLTVTIAETARRGFGASLLIVLGHAVLELILLIGLLLGLFKLLEGEIITIFFGFVGGMVLLGMGFSLILSVIKKRISFQMASGESRASLGPFLSGIIVSLSNPYWLLWWITIGGVFLIKAMDYRLLGISSFFTGHISSDLLWYGFVGLAVSTGKRYISDSVFRGVLLACGIFLLFLGGKFMWDASVVTILAQ